jgi:hypothetical protein
MARRCGLGLTLAIGLSALLSLQAAQRAESAPRPGTSVAPLAAQQIVEKNAAARGGLDAWRKVQTLAFAGHTETTGSNRTPLSFLLEQKRPDRTRFEILVDGQRSARIFDGQAGWKMRASRNGMPDLQPYAAEELNYARGAQVIEGPLMDYVGKGAAITVLGVDTVSGRDAYVMDAKLPAGGLHRVWIDAQTFVDLRHDREYRDASGTPVISTVLYSDYRSFEELVLPVVIETGAAPGRPTNKLVIEKVAINPQLDDQVFAKPNLVGRRHRGVTVDTRSAAMPVPSHAQRP